MIIDGSTLWLLGFNSTHLDVFRSRSLGLVTTDQNLVQEAIALFEADSNRDPFKSRVPNLIVSPENARARLAALIKSARKQLLVYDPKVSDAAMLRLLHDRSKAGVDVRIIGKVTIRGDGLQAAKLPKLRLHVRAIVRDGMEAFIGSQSLRGLELDRRREVGVVVRNRRVARQIQAAFEADWEQARPAPKDKDTDRPEEAAPAAT
jgi:phosphatidylserine/phosphatidylglycerophosphate/cardiolipin synthase-like enzyme